jgi:putative transposase
VKNAIYDSNLTDAQWDFLKPMLPKPSQRGRPPTDRRRIMDAILYQVKCGNPWHYLPTDFPPWKTVYHILRQWTLNHQWAALNDALRTLVRKDEGKRSQPTAAIMDSQSVKSDGHDGLVGYTQPNGSRAASGICWWTRWGWSSEWS